ncbi:MAG: hypothetical protein HYV26_14780 [Candidatus Hydrogenedentes bacterium]|nr:hypothetical protein [Candidatus Hydrogenedentota bacterium]
MHSPVFSSSNLSKGRRSLRGLVLILAGAVGVGGVASAGDMIITLDSITPASASFLGGVSVVLRGDFSTVFNTGPLAVGTFTEVYFSPFTIPMPNTDWEARIVSISDTEITAITPRVPGPTTTNGTHRVYVRKFNTILPVNLYTNQIDFRFTDTGETELEAAARTLNDNFDFLDTDNDGALSLNEAADIGVTPDQFEALDDNDDGQLTQEELANGLPEPTFLERLLELLGRLTNIAGILAFVLSLLQKILNLLRGPFVVS